MRIEVEAGMNCVSHRIVRVGVGPRANRARRIVIELDPEDIKLSLRDKLTHVWLWEITLWGTRDDIFFAWILSEVLTESVDQCNVAGSII